MELKIGTLLKHGDYVIEKVIGQGGFGITYLACQTGHENCDSHAYNLDFGSYDRHVDYYGSREYGFTVRPVCDK